MDSDEEVRPRDVAFAFSDRPRLDFKDAVVAAAGKDRRIRLGASIRDDDHGCQALLILYCDVRNDGFAIGHRLLGTDVAFERKMGPRGLKTK